MLELVLDTNHVMLLQQSFILPDSLNFVRVVIIVRDAGLT